MAPTFQRSTSDISAMETQASSRNQQSKQVNQNSLFKNSDQKISDSLNERRSMVAGILSAGPPKKKSNKYSRALTQPIQPADRSEPTPVVKVAKTL